MSYSEPNRLDRAEALIAQITERTDANSQQITQLTQTTQFLTTAQLELPRSVDVIVQRMDGLAQRMDGLAQRTDGLTERVGQVEQQILLLAHSQQLAFDAQRSLVSSIETIAQNVNRLAITQD